MKRNEKRFQVKRFVFETSSDEKVERYMITDNLLPLFEINQWLEMKSLRNSATGKDYAYRLCVYLNYLDECHLSYDHATNKTVTIFIRRLIYGSLENLKLLSRDSAVTYSTLSKYVTVITGFYEWLESYREIEMRFYSRHNTIRAQKSFLYGQIYSSNYKYLVDQYLPILKSGREYIKWYDDDEKQALSNNFLTLRDEAVFRLTLEGFRIDEALSIWLGNYDPIKRIIQPARSKRQQSATIAARNHLRTIALPIDTCTVIDKYIATERVLAENGSGVVSQYLFINLRRGRNFGGPLAYRNYLEILKSCAKRAGLDPEKIRTHSGRSTKVMEFIEHSVLHPEDALTDAILIECFGWRRVDSIEPYRDHNNQVVAKAVMEKLHKKGGGSND